MSNIEKAVLGALGGLSAVLVKFLGQDYAIIVSCAGNLTADQILGYKVGYGLLTPILMFLGAFIAWISEEQKRIKIVALAVAAPAMITTWSGGQKQDHIAFNDFFISSAYAQSSNLEKQSLIPVNPDVKTNRSTWQKIRSGVGTFFGYGSEPQRYWVIVGSYKDINAARQFADKINAEDKTLNARVGARMPDNNYYPVIVGNYIYLTAARELKSRALATKTINEAYFSTVKQR
jgi:hypothetical protein